MDRVSFGACTYDWVHAGKIENSSLVMNCLTLFGLTCPVREFDVRCSMFLCEMRTYKVEQSAVLLYKLDPTLTSVNAPNIRI